MLLQPVKTIIGLAVVGLGWMENILHHHMYTAAITGVLARY